MAHHKVTCQQCPEYGKCSQRTRMFVNYCGSRQRSIEQHIHLAILDCRSKGGYMFRHHVLPAIRIQCFEASATPSVAA